VHFNPETDAEKFYRKLAMLYYPWKDEDNLKKEAESYQDRYQALKDSISKVREEFEPYAEAVDEASRRVQALDDIDETWDQLAPMNQLAEAKDIRNSSSPVDVGIEDYDIAQDMGLPITNVEEDLHSYNEMPDHDYREHMRKLNKMQLDFVYEIIYKLKTSAEPVYRFLSGGAGVGKSFVTIALYQTAIKYLNKKEGGNYNSRKVLLLAPTGKAAYHIQGNTIHSALKIPPNQKLD
jgi:DNA replication protein DnaC